VYSKLGAFGRASRALALVGALGLSLISFSAPAGAEIASYAEDTWGVYNSVVGGTLTETIDSEVMAMERIGNLVYVGGKFTEVRQNNGAAPVSQSYLAAFDARTGAYVSSFDVDLGGPVYALQASPDGSRLFVGGEFNDVAGVPNTRALVALDPFTGAVDTSWKAQVKLNGRASVYELDADNNWLYVGGSFDGVGGGEGVARLNVGNVARLSLVGGTPDYGFDPFANGGSVWGIAASPDGTRVYVSGYFTNVNGVGGSDGFVALDTSGNVVGTPLNGLHNNVNRKYYLDVEAVNGLVFVAGMEHIVYVLDASNLSVITRHSTGGTNNAAFQTGGDYQDLEVVGDRVYGSNHARGSHFANGDIYRWLLGQGGSSGVWGMVEGPDGCMWFGGDLTRATRANGTNQGRGGFTKHCDPAVAVDSVRPSVPGGVTVTAAGRDVNLTWNPSVDNVAVTGYQIYRATSNGGTATLIGATGSTSYTDVGLPNGTYWYYVRASDAAGNLSWRTGYRSATVPGAGGGGDTERPSTPSGLVLESAWRMGASVSWNGSTDNVGVAGYQLFDADTDQLIATTTGATNKFVGSLTPGTSYRIYVKAIDAAGNASWRSNILTFNTQP
jgi:trimeric autotransporter adhesin